MTIEHQKRAAEACYASAQQRFKLIEFDGGRQRIRGDEVSEEYSEEVCATLEGAEPTPPPPPPLTALTTPQPAALNLTNTGSGPDALRIVNE
jgi:hypothetical protein